MSEQIVEVDQDWPCEHCGTARRHHRLANWSDGPHVGDAFLVCPSATFTEAPVKGQDIQAADTTKR